MHGWHPRLVESCRCLDDQSGLNVEQMIGRAQILLGKTNIKANLQNEIAVCPIDPVLNKVKITLMMDGGWEQCAPGKAYSSSSGHVLSVGGRTKKVCFLVYYTVFKKVSRTVHFRPCTMLQTRLTSWSKYFY